MLPDMELTQMRSDAELLMPDTCNLLAVTETADGYGGVSKTWGTVTASVACRLDNASKTRQAESLVAQSIQPFSEWVLSVPYGTGITTAMRVEVRDDTYNVIAEDVERSWLVVERAILEMV